MKVIIIGNGLGGVTTASNILKLDRDVEIHVFSEEEYPYYSRVRLIDYIIGKISFDDVIVYNQSWYDSRGINLHLKSKVVKINTNKNKISYVSLDDPDTELEMEYDYLVIATGSKPIIPHDPEDKTKFIKGLEKKGWYILRNIDDAKKIKEGLKQAERITILGSGLLGLELADAFHNPPISKDTSIIEIEPMVAPVYLDRQGALVLYNLLERAGIKCLLQTQVTELVGEKKIEGCRLADKTIHKGDMVIFACGIYPNVDLVKNTPIKVGDGIIVNEFLQTSVKNIFAVGDCSEYDEFIYGINPAAIEQAKYYAYNIVRPDGKKKTYSGTVPSVSFSGFNTELISIGQVNDYTIIDPSIWNEVYS
ncbi:MAG: NAD(P)/FAD-dependent oxidoreductase [Promethearchaeota archaeon]